MLEWKKIDIEMKRDDAVKHAEALEGGWRLPSLDDFAYVIQFGPDNAECNDNKGDIPEGPLPYWTRHLVRHKFGFAFSYDGPNISLVQKLDKLKVVVVRGEYLKE